MSKPTTQEQTDPVTTDVPEGKAVDMSVLSAHFASLGINPVDVTSMPEYKRWTEMKTTLDRILPRRSHNQMAIHNEMLAICAPLIFDADCPAAADAIRDALNVYTYRSQRGLLIDSPRREGKTTAIASFVTAMLLLVPDINIIIYTASRKTSVAMHNQVHRLLSDNTEQGGFSFSATTHRGFVVEDIDGPRVTRNYVTIVSDIAEARAVGGCQLVIWDEMAFVAQDMYVDGCLRATPMNGTVLIGISTPAHQPNIFAHAENAKDGNGRKIFNKVCLSRSPPLEWREQLHVREQARV
jgi:hypothetical protein